MAGIPYELKLARYSGPLDKLLELIEAREMEVAEISLAEVTDDFLKYLETLQIARARATDFESRQEMLRFLADFIVVASRLVFIKSKSLLPELGANVEEETDIRDLEKRLRLYKDLKPMMKTLATLWNRGALSMGRPYFLNTVTPGDRQGGVVVFYPGPGVTTATLSNSLGRIFEIFERLAKHQETITDTIVSLEEKIAEVVSRIRAIMETNFRALTGGESRGEVIITFLAVLHLAREQLIILDQAGDGSDIMIRSNGNGETIS
ncbi:MAG: segregation/condensation protein A [Patescibacteria group bacterium]